MTTRRRSQGRVTVRGRSRNNEKVGKTRMIRRSGRGMDDEAMGKGWGRILRKRKKRIRRGGGRGGRGLQQRGAAQTGDTLTTMNLPLTNHSWRQ